MQGKKVESAAEVLELVEKKKSVVYGTYGQRVPAAVLVNFTFAHVTNMIARGQIFVYEKEEKKPDGRISKTKS